MQTDLPWNVAGIPPEAREAARAAARREGLSVGEWLTRRILRGLTDNGDSGSWPRNATGPNRLAVDDEPIGRDSDAMLERIQRSEADSGSASRKVEDQLKTLGRRLEATERAQSEQGRAVSQAASEINIAAREQAQAFDQLGQHVVELGERIARVERGAGTDGVRDAMKGLHSGLSRLADQISETANKSANQIATLAGNVESVAGRLSEVRSETGGTIRALEARIGAFESRVQSIESAAQSTAARLEAALSGFEAVQGIHRAGNSETQRQAQLLLQVNDALDKLAERISANEAQSAGIMSRLEEQLSRADARRDEALEKLAQRIAAGEELSAGALARLDEHMSRSDSRYEETVDRLNERLASSEAQNAGALARLEDRLSQNAGYSDDAPFDRRLQGIEHALSDIVGRLENTERNSGSATRMVEDSLRSFATRLDAVDRRQNEVLAEYRAAPRQDAAPPPPPPPGPDFDLPPFPDAHGHAGPYGHEAEYPAYSNNPSMSEFGGDPFAQMPPPSQAAAGSTDSYIAAARRSAREAAAAQAPAAGWTAAAAPNAALLKNGSSRIALVAGSIVLASAVLMGLFLSRSATIATQSSLPVARVDALAPVANNRAQEPMTPESSNVPASLSGPPSVPASAPVPVPSSVRSQQTRIEQTSAAPPVSNVAPPVAQSAPPIAAAPAVAADRVAALAAAGSAKAQVLMGYRYLDGDGVAVNEAQGAKWLERAASQGEALAAYRLGTLYERGHGVAADPSRAVQWYATAAKLGNRKAMHNLAVAYAEGTGTPKDLGLAAQWFSKAANLGLADSQFNLAVLYERGMGVTPSLMDAYKWYAVAAAQGDAGSKSRLNVIATQLSADERAAADKAAADFHPLPMDRNANTPPDPSSLQ
jgi:localization factor PodJL